MAEEKKKKKAHGGHGYKSVRVTHHRDGSATIRHEHEDGVSHSEHAVSDINGIHDSLEDHEGGGPTEEESALDRGEHGVPDEHAGPAGLMPSSGAGA